MARITQKRRRRARDSSLTLGSSSESDGGVSGGSGNERVKPEKQEKRWQLRRSTMDERVESKKQERRWQFRRSTMECRAKRKNVVEEEEEEYEFSETSSSEDDSASDEEQEKREMERRDFKGAFPKDRLCGICFSEGRKKRGKLDCCDHFFCFTCIMEWSKVESRCPICKQRFATISGVSRSHTRSFRIAPRDQIYEPSEEEMRAFADPYLNTVCTECHEAGEEGLLLLCDRCDAAAHTYCVGLGQSVPEGNWFCHACQARELVRSEEVDGEAATGRT